MIILAINAYGQELNCNVAVLTQQIQSSDKKIFNTLQTAIYEFMNNTQWTTDKFLNQERIECTMQIQITERISSDEFKGNIQVQSSRPIYNTSYNSPLMNIKDDNFSFRYVEFQTIEFRQTGTNTNLAAVLAYYAYLILGMDYESFSPGGGTPYFQKAQDIVADQQNSPERGWRAFESTRNRYWITENLNKPLYKPLRQFIYDYHRVGLDNLNENKDDTITILMDGLEEIQGVRNSQPNSYLLQIFFFTKADEMVNIFSMAFPEQKTRAVNLLNEVDPANGSKYQAILKN
jgi:hypothetical protein